MKNILWLLFENAFNGEKSFLFTLLGVFFALASWRLISSFFLLRLLLSLKRSFLLLHDFLILLYSFCVHLDGGMAEATIVSIPMLGHEGAGATGGAGLARLSDAAFA